MLDHIEREIIKAAEGPNADREQLAELERRMLGDDEKCGNAAQQKEEKPLEKDQAWVFEISHRSSGRLNKRKRR